MWIVAGPNGSGKSTLYTRADIDGFGPSIWIINPDLLSLRLHQQEGLPLRDANVEALIRIEAWLGASIRAHQTVGVETVLSTDKYRKLVLAAKALNFEINLLYVLLRDVQLNIQRVRLRVAAGGHDVPKNKIRERRIRSLQQLPWFLERADTALIFDNSGARPVKIGQKIAGRIILDPGAPPEIKEAAESLRPRQGS